MTEKQTNTKKPLKQFYAEKLEQEVRIAKFRGTVIIKSSQNWYDMSHDRFAAACYKQFGSSITKSMINDLEHLFRTTAEDLSEMSHYILFEDRVWDSKRVEYNDLPDEDRDRLVYGVPYIPREGDDKIRFILDLACGDENVYDDIMQSVAALLLDRKPLGVFWYLGKGQNGKSSLTNLIHRIFGSYLTEITVKQLEDERDAPQLNGKIGNILRESSEALIKDTRTYKSIGAHENFMVHKFHSQEMTSVNGNVHHIFSANNIPTFSDKSDGAKRRTLLISFNNWFEQDETFEDRTFTKEFIERFLGEMVKYARIIKDNNYSYSFSSVSRAVKQQYDFDTNPAAAYMDEIILQGVIGFDGFRNLYLDFENWSKENGYMPSSINVFRRMAFDKGYKRQSRRIGNKVANVYTLKDANPQKFENFGQDRPGLFRLTEIIKSEEQGNKIL